MNHIGKYCVHCGRGPLLPHKQSRGKGHSHRTHTARGLCTSCYSRLERNNELEKYPCLMRSRFDVFEDYVELAKQGFSREVIADRLGMKLTSMEKALQRIANENNMEVPYVPKRF